MSITAKQSSGNSSSNMLGAALSKVVTITKTVLIAYAQFVTPIAVFIAFNMCISTHTRDAEKFGLQWLHYTAMEESDRAQSFPLTQSESRRGGNSASASSDE